MIATEKIISNLPSKEPCDIDFIKFLDEFDPAAVSEEGLSEFSRRNPFVTAYGFEPPIEPVGRRLQ